MCFFIDTKSELTRTLTNYCGNDVGLALQAEIYLLETSYLPYWIMGLMYVLCSQRASDIQDVSGGFLPVLGFALQIDQ